MVDTRFRIGLIGKGGQRIGMGHLVRLRLLHDELSSFDVTMFSNRDAVAENFLKKTSGRIAFYRDYKELYKLLKRRGNYDLLIVDALNVPEFALRKLRTYCTSLIVFDDMHHTVNKNIRGVIICPQETYRIAVTLRGHSCILRGADFFQSVPHFNATERKVRYVSAVKNIVICLGGTPPLKAMYKLAETLDNTLDKKLKIHFVGGYSSDMVRTSGFSRRIVFHKHITNMAAFLSKMDMGIISGGFIKFECMCLGLPFLLIARNPHQEELACRFASQGFGEYAGRLSEISKHPERLRKMVRKMLDSKKLRKTMSLRSRRLVDGEGINRISNFAHTLMKRGTL